MTREDMLRAEVSRHLATAGLPFDAEATTAAIESVRSDAAELLELIAAPLAACQNAECTCKAGAAIYDAIAAEVRDPA